VLAGMEINMNMLTMIHQPLKAERLVHLPTAIFQPMKTTTIKKTLLQATTQVRRKETWMDTRVKQVARLNTKREKKREALL